jgi:hypothetical protein
MMTTIERKKALAWKRVANAGEGSREQVEAALEYLNLCAKEKEEVMTPEREELIRRTWEQAQRNSATWEYLRKNRQVNLPIRYTAAYPPPPHDFTKGPRPNDEMALCYSYARKYNDLESLCLHDVTCEGVIVYSHIESCERV